MIATKETFTSRMYARWNFVEANLEDEGTNCSSTSDAFDSGNIFFSEFGEGSSYNKFVEIYNGGKTEVFEFF